MVMSFACVYIADFLVQSGGAGAARACGWGAGVDQRGAAAVERGGGESGGVRSSIQLGMTKAQVTQFARVQICMRSGKRRSRPRTPLCWTRRGAFRRAWKIPRRTRWFSISMGSLHFLALTKTLRRNWYGGWPRLAWLRAFAVAANIEVAIHAARGFPGITIIPAGEERGRLGALPVGILTTEAETLDILELGVWRRCKRGDAAGFATF